MRSHWANARPQTGPLWSPEHRSRRPPAPSGSSPPVGDSCQRHPSFDFFDHEIRPSDFEVVFAIAADWVARSRAGALPFFSKVNLRNVASELSSRGFRIALDRTDY
ncbi:MAG: DUF6119 family protein [Solirubrobacteraceae bacterium]